MDANKPEAEVEDPIIGAAASGLESPGKAPLGLRTVAMFEFVKGFLVLLMALALVSLVHRDAARVIKDIVLKLHVNPDHHYLVLFFKYAGNLDDRKLWGLAGIALLYATIRFVETYGLWHERPWAEWFAVISAGLYLPFEIYHLAQEPEKLARWAILVGNIAIVAYLAYLLSRNSGKAHARRSEG